MFDLLRKIRLSDEEKRQEALSAYLDNELSSREMEHFERELAADASLQAELEQQRRLKQQLQNLPRARAPRNFTLDPALYGRPETQRAYQAYPVLRTATVLAVFFFFVALTADFFSGTGFSPLAPASDEAAQVMDSDTSMAEEAEPELAAPGLVEVTRLVVEEVITQVTVEAAEEPAAEDMAGDEAMSADEDEVVEEQEVADDGLDAGDDSADAADPEEMPAAGGTNTLTVTATAVPTLPPTATPPAQDDDSEGEGFVAETPTSKPVPTETVPAPTETFSADTEETVVTKDDLPFAQLEPEADNMPAEERGAAESETAAEPGGWRLAQIIFGAVAVLLLAATLLLRRQL